MPCHDPWADTQHHKELAAKVSKLTRMLCEACKWLEANGVDINDLPTELANWYGEHLILDARRKVAESLAIREEEARQAVLAKLTPKERILLGLKESTSG